MAQCAALIAPYWLENDSLSVMAGLRPGHPRLSCFSAVKTWMPGTRPRMTDQTARPNFIGRFFSQDDDFPLDR
jgi:hypothetical protein